MHDQRNDPNRTAKKSEGPNAPKQTAGTSRPTAEAFEMASETFDAAEAAAAETAAATQHTLTAAAEIARTGNDAVQQTVQSGLDMATQISERVARTFGLPSQANTDATKHATQNVQLLMDCGTVLAHGLQDIGREWLDQSRDRLQKNLDSFGALLRARTLEDAIAVQSDLTRENLKDLLEGSRRTSERMASLSNEAMKIIAAQDRRAEREVRR